MSDTLPLRHAEGRSFTGQVSPVSQRDTELEIIVKHGYAVSIGNLVWVLTKRESNQEGLYD